MRTYLPVTLNHIVGPWAEQRRVDFQAGHVVYGVTAQLIAAWQEFERADTGGSRRGGAARGQRSLSGDELEELELMALLAAAADSAFQILSQPTLVWQRVVLALDVPDAAVRSAGGSRSFEDTRAGIESGGESPGHALSMLEIKHALSGVPVKSAHVDEQSVARLVQQGLDGEDGALQEWAEADLLWYAPSELPWLPGLPATN